MKCRLIKKKTFKTTILILSIIIIPLIFTACTSKGVKEEDDFSSNYSKYFKEESAKVIKTWNRLSDAGVVEELDISIEDNGIRVTVEGVIAEEFKTLILLKVEDLNGNAKFRNSFNVKDGADIAEKIELSGDLKEIDEFPSPMTSVSSLYQEEEGINKLLIQTNPINENEGQINLKIREFMSTVSKDGEITPLINIEEDVERVRGNWDMGIETKKLESYKYKVDKQIVIDGNEIKINNIIIAPTETNIEYEFKVFNKEEKYYLDSLKFFIEYEDKIYDYPKLGSSVYQYIANSSYGTLKNNEVASFESLYLEKPDNINLILNSYRYKTKYKKSYDLDLDNLPQKLEYQDSILTVESIKDTDDLMAITIKEDDNKDRKYISTNMYIDFPVILNDNSKTTIQSHSGFFVSHNPEKLEEQIITMTKRYDTNSDGEMESFDEDIKSVLKPERILIEGQEYVKYPDKKINIKFKD